MPKQQKTTPTILPKNYQQKLTNGNFAQKKAKSNETRREKVIAPIDYVQILRTTKKRNKTSQKHPKHQTNRIETMLAGTHTIWKTPKMRF